MTRIPPSERHAERFVLAVAKRWGLDEHDLRNHLSTQVRLLLRARGSGVEGTLDEMLVALDAEPGDTRLLQPLAITFRNAVLRPILQRLSGWLRARLAYKLGAASRICLDDAVNQTLKALVDHWKEWWTTEEPRAQEHLQRYALLTAMRMARRMLRAERTREARLNELVVARPDDPETQVIRALEERQRAIAESKLKDLDWLLQVLPPAEANAVIRWQRSDPTAGLSAREVEASRKAYQRAKSRLRKLVDQLVEDRRREPRLPAHCPCTVEHLGQTIRFHVVDYSSGGVGLEGAQDISLELGEDCTVRIHSGSTLVVRGARCVRIERADGVVRIGLRFHFPHPLPALARQERSARPTF